MLTVGRHGRHPRANVEGFWSLVERGIGGVYHAVSQKYFQSYLNEYSFRYSRKAANEPMFVSLLSQVGEGGIARAAIF